MFETIRPDKVLMKLVMSAKFQERTRKLDALRLLRAMIVAAATGYGGRQAEVMRLYFESGATRVGRGVFIMVEIPALARAYASAMKRDLPGLLGEFVTDWHTLDSSTVKREPAALGEYHRRRWLRRAEDPGVSRKMVCGASQQRRGLNRLVH